MVTMTSIEVAGGGGHHWKLNMSSEKRSTSLEGVEAAGFLSAGGAAKSSKKVGVSPESPKSESSEGLEGVVAGVLPAVPFAAGLGDGDDAPAKSDESSPNRLLSLPPSRPPSLQQSHTTHDTRHERVSGSGRVD